MKHVKKPSAVIALLLILALLSSCGAEKLSLQGYPANENLASKSVRYDKQGNEMKSGVLSYDNTRRSFMTVDLGDSKRFNTVTLTEKGNCIKQFALYASNEKDKNYTFLYQGDTIGSFRVCYTGTVQYRYLRLFVTDFEGDFRIENLSVYLNKSDYAKDLRVTAYLRADFVNENTDFSPLQGCTDVILFGGAKFDANGNILFVNGSGEQVEEKEYAEIVRMLKDAVDGMDIRILADVAMPYGNDNKDIAAMMGSNLDNTADSLRSFLYRYGFDGYDVDYEYPHSDEEWDMYNAFLLRIREAIPDKILSVAGSSWYLGYTQDVIDKIDRFELMTYDAFDSFGYHSTFSTTAECVQKTLDAGFRREQIEIGIPYYSRPVDGYAYWGGYSEFADLLGKYNNLAAVNTFDHDGAPLATPQYFNCVQMVSDKTAYAVDEQLGGVMIWHISCDMPYDSELSLTRAITSVKQQKSVSEG